MGSDCFNMKTFVGRIVTVSDGAGQSVTVSNWGVAQSSRHHAVRGYPRDSPPVSLLISVLQHVLVLYVLNLHYDSLEVTCIIKSVGWGYWGVGGCELI